MISRLEPQGIHISMTIPETNVSREVCFEACIVKQWVPFSILISTLENDEIVQNWLWIPFGRFKTGASIQRMDFRDD